MLYLIGIGLGNEKDITLNGFEAVKRCSKLYLESYTSISADSDVNDLERFYQKKIILADRELIENKINNILNDARKEDVGILVIGSPLIATTHIEILIEAKKKGIKLEIIDNASVITAVGITGLQAYKFGKIASIPFDNENVKSAYEIYLNNKKLGMHTLFLLDIKGNRLMSAEDGVSYLIRNGFDGKTRIVGCGGLGGKNPEIRYGEARKIKIKRYPQCIIIPGELHFKEEEALEMHKAS